METSELLRKLDLIDEHARRALEEHHRARGGNRREPVDDTRELEGGPRDDPLTGELREELLLPGE